MISSLILIEHEGGRVKRASLSSIALARELGGNFALLVVGSGVEPIGKAVTRFGASEVLVADDPALAEPLADRYAEVIVQAARSVGAATVLGTTSTFTKDILPRAAALLDAPMLTDVMAIEVREEVMHYRRPLSAGSLWATVRLDSDIRVLTARAAAFTPPEPGEGESAIRALRVDAASLPNGMEFVSREQRELSRPDLTEARVVVSGGRPLKDRDTFERLIGGLADALGGAVGATRAAVDAGMAPNDCQVGQTGKSVAPELYIGVGVSGAIQHLAGIQDSRVIVAINRDPEAPIFQMATYGLVGDLHDIVPRLIKAVRPEAGSC